MFKSARIKLTTYYLLIIMLITISFSAVVYSRVSDATERALQMHERRVNNRLMNLNNPPQPPFWQPLNEETVKEMKRNTLTNLIFINIFILLVAGIPGYWLAGMTLKPIEEMIEKQKKFVADAAHELKTPLTAIKTYLEVNLRNKKMDLKGSKKVMGDTIKDVDSLTILINSLLKQSRYQNYIDNGIEDINLKSLVMEVAEKMRGRLQKKKIKIKISGESTEINANRESISELITILLDNAIKFNKENGKIEINLDKRGGFVYISFEDNGIGIEEKDIPYIFDRFYKADTSRSKSESEGFGLGLSIAKEIVESHKGIISVKSKRDSGTTFIIKLPTK